MNEWKKINEKKMNEKMSERMNERKNEWKNEWKKKRWGCLNCGFERENKKKKMGVTELWI